MAMEDIATPQPPTRFQPLIIAAVCAVAAAARLVGIGFNLAEDEIFSVQLNSHAWRSVIEGSLADKPHPPLYNILLHFWIAVFGESEVTVRLLTVLLAVGAVSIYFLIMRARIRPVAAICGALVMGLSGFLIYYGQEARPYGLISLVGAANIWAFLRVLRAPDDRYNILAWAASALLFVYSQYFGAVYLLVEGVILLAFLPLRVALRVLAPAVLASSCILPWMWAAFRAHRTLTEIGWITAPNLRDLPYFFVGAIGFPPLLSGWLLLAAVAALVIAGTERAIHAGLVSKEFVAFAALAAIPPAIAFALSYMLGFSVWAPRQIITSAFAFIGLLAFLVDSLPRVAGRIAACALVLWAGAGASDGFPSNYEPNWSEVLLRIKQEDAHAIVLAEEGHMLRPLRYYGSRQGLHILDMQDAQFALPTSSFYYVCRPQFCQQLLALNLEATGLGPPVKHPWGNLVGRVQDMVLVYRFAPRRTDVRNSIH